MATAYDTILAAVRAAAAVVDPTLHHALIDWDESRELPQGDRHVLLRVVSEVDEDPQPVGVETKVGEKIKTVWASRSLIAVDVRVETIHATELPHLTFATQLRGALQSVASVRAVLAEACPSAVLVDVGQMFNRSAPTPDGVTLPQSTFEARFRAQSFEIEDPTTTTIINSTTAEGTVDKDQPTEVETTVTATRP